MDNWPDFRNKDFIKYKSKLVKILKGIADKQDHPEDKNMINEFIDNLNQDSFPAEHHWVAWSAFQYALSRKSDFSDNKCPYCNGTGYIKKDNLSEFTTIRDIDPDSLAYVMYTRNCQDRVECPECG